MTVESVTYISDLNPANPAAGDNPSEGAAHIRNLKTAEKNTFPNVAGVVSASHTELSYVTGVTSAIQTQINATGSLKLLASATASSSATVDFTTLINSTYKEYELHIINAIPASNAVPWLVTSANAGVAWDTGASNYLWVISVSAVTTNTVTNSAGDAKMALHSTVSNIASGGGFCAVVKFFDPAATASYKRFNWIGSAYNGNPESVNGSGFRAATAALNGLRFMFSTGNIASGEFRLYGVRNA